MELAGLARTDRAGWGSEFDDVVEEILRSRDEGIHVGEDVDGTDGAHVDDDDDDDGEEWH